MGRMGPLFNGGDQIQLPFGTLGGGCSRLFGLHVLKRGEDVHLGVSCEA
jgi:hypothetical protein